MADVTPLMLRDPDTGSLHPLPPLVVNDPEELAQEAVHRMRTTEAKGASDALAALLGSVTDDAIRRHAAGLAYADVKAALERPVGPAAIVAWLNGMDGLAWLLARAWRTTHKFNEAKCRKMLSALMAEPSYQQQLDAAIGQPEAPQG